VGSAIVIGTMRFLAIETRPVAPIVIGTALVLLAPLVTEFEVPGDFAFYIVWQAGFAVALARSPAQP
jgi:hypothetical protein